MRKLYVIALLCFLALAAAVGEGRAQQMYQFTQYMFNHHLINPAVVGTHSYYQIRTNHRFQWVGVDDAPMTNTVSVNGPHSKLPMGFGGIFFSDITGPSNRNGLMGSYGYNIALNDNLRLSGGLSLGFMIYQIDASKFDLGDNFHSEGFSDPALLRFKPTALFTPDASIGIFLYSAYYHAGVAVTQLFGQRLSFHEAKLERWVSSNLRQAYYIHGGYLLYLSDDYELEPTLVLRYTYPKPFQFDLNVKLTYRDKVWGGVSYRLNDAVSFMVGYKHDRHILIGYSYDYSYTGIRKFSYGTHELMIGYQFDKIK